jgi:hypothetical protein
MDPVKAISWKKRRAKQLEDWTEAICYEKTLIAFTDVVFGVRYFFPDPSELLHGLVRLGIVQYRRYLDLDANENRLGVFISPNLGHRAVYYLYKRQHEEFVTPENSLTHEDAMLNTRRGMDLYSYEIEEEVEYEEVEKGKKRQRKAVWDFYSEEENKAVEVETGKNNAAQVARHVRAALHTGVNLSIVIPEWSSLRLLNYYTQCVFRGLSRSRRLPAIKIELRDIVKPREVLRWIEVGNRPRLKSSIPERYYTVEEEEERYYDSKKGRYEWKTKTKKFLTQIKVPYPREVRVRESYSFSMEKRESDLWKKFKTWRTPWK